MPPPFPAEPAAPHIQTPQQQFLRAPAQRSRQLAHGLFAAPGHLPPWAVGYFVMPGAGPELTASVSGRISSTCSLPLP